MQTLVEVAKKEVAAVHRIDKFDELGEKKNIFRKIINLFHQMEYNLDNNHSFLQVAINDN